MNTGDGELNSMEFNLLAAGDKSLRLEDLNPRQHPSNHDLSALCECAMGDAYVEEKCASYYIAYH